MHGSLKIHIVNTETTACIIYLFKFDIQFGAIVNLKKIFKKVKVKQKKLHSIMYTGIVKSLNCFRLYCVM